MDFFERKLSAYLYRISCPSPEELGEYHLKMLQNDQAETIRRHLDTCPHCTRELAQLQSYLSDVAPDVEFTFQERVKIWIAKRLPKGLEDGFSAAPAPAFALRGEAEGPMMFEAGSYQLTVEIQDDPANPGLRSVLGLAIGGADTLERVALWQDGRAIQ
jgi:hypothetical protein